jgi:hypothetical protein
MRAKHTPGPWHVQYPSSNDPELAIVGGGIVIADMYGVHDTPQANARLIAAAPELLELVRAYSGTVEPVTLAKLDKLAKALLARIDGE